MIFHSYVKLPEASFVVGHPASRRRKRMAHWGPSNLHWHLHISLHCSRRLVGDRDPQRSAPKKKTTRPKMGTPSLIHHRFGYIWIRITIWYIQTYVIYICVCVSVCVRAHHVFKCFDFKVESGNQHINQNKSTVSGCPMVLQLASPGAASSSQVARDPGRGRSLAPTLRMHPP